MQAQFPTATALGSVWLLMILLPGGTEAAPTIPTKTAIIILAAIAAIYFIVCALCILIIVLWIVCSRKSTRTRCKVCPASHTQYVPQGQNNEQKKPPRLGEPCPKKTLFPKDGIAVRSISQEYLRKDGGVVTYTATAQTVTIAEKPSPLVVPCPVRPSPLLVAKQKPAASKLDNVTVIENQWWEEGSSSSGGGSSISGGSRSDEVFEKQPPPSEPTSSGTIEERREEVLSSRKKKGRTDSTRPLLNGSESRGPSESGESDAHNISYSHQAVTQDPPDYAYPKVEPPRRKKPSLDRTDSTKPLLTRSDSSEPATPTDPNPVAQNTLQAMTQDPKDYEHPKRPKHKFAGISRKALSSGKISTDVVLTNQWYANDLPDTREEEEEDAEGCESML